ncbi:MAG: hypothetical protein IT359_17075 [Gemmatimonadaceae bacterium]|nr:hypothetical protein [Gemmatimonadaceae bacterium]
MRARNFLGTTAAILLSATALTAQATPKPAHKAAAVTAAKATDSTKKAVSATDSTHKKARKHATAAKKP